jgi:vacuolar-type H+-ATPase subunit H
MNELGYEGIAAIVIALYLCRGTDSLCFKGVSYLPKKMLQTIKTARNGTEAAETAGRYFEKIDKLFLGTGKYNEEQLQALLKIELKKRTISQKDYDALMMLSKQDIRQIRAALQRSKVSVTIKGWIEHPENVREGDAKNISKALGKNRGLDEKFKKELQKIEDYYLDKQASDNSKNIKQIVNRGIKTLKNPITAAWKIDNASMQKWFDIYKSNSSVSTNDRSLFIELKDYIIKHPGQRPSTSAIIWGRQRIVKFIPWYQDFKYWLDSSKGTSTYPGYLQMSEFPSYEQWKSDMYNVDFDKNKINQTEYNLQKWYFQYSK